MGLLIWISLSSEFLMTSQTSVLIRFECESPSVLRNSEGISEEESIPEATAS